MKMNLLYFPLLTERSQHQKEQKDSASSAWLEITFVELETMKISQTAD